MSKLRCPDNRKREKGKRDAAKKEKYENRKTFCRYRFGFGGGGIGGNDNTVLDNHTEKERKQQNCDILYTSLKNNNPVQLTSHLIDFDIEDLSSGSSYATSSYDYDDDDYDDDENNDDNEIDITQYYAFLVGSTKLNNDGKRVFFPDKFQSFSQMQSSYSLYYKDLYRSEEEEAVKVDSDVMSYEISTDGNTVTYLKKEDKKLYSYNLTDKEKIDDDVSDYYVSDDGQKIWYTTNEGGLYLKYVGKDTQKLESNLESTIINYKSIKINKAMDTVWYLKDGSVYKISEGKDKEKLVSGVETVKEFYDGGEFYYIKEDKKVIKLSDFIDDDLTESDSKITEPEEPSWSYYRERYFDDYYETYDDMCEAYNNAYEKYEEKMEKWYDKEERDDLRDDLEDEDLTLNTLCYYDGNKEKVLSKNYYMGNFSFYDDEISTPIYAFTSYPSSLDYKIKLSEISDDLDNKLDELFSTLNSKFEAEQKTYICIKDNMSETELSDLCAVTKDGKTIYYYDDGDVYEMNISAGKTQKGTLYESDVDRFILVGDSDTPLVVKDDVLYLNKQKIDNVDNDDAFILAYYDDKVFYENSDGVTKMIEDGKSVKITDDGTYATVTPGGDVLYLYDYSDKYKKGDLYIYKNGKSEKLDFDVEYIVSRSGY